MTGKARVGLLVLSIVVAGCGGTGPGASSPAASSPAAASGPAAASSPAASGPLTASPTASAPSAAIPPPSAAAPAAPSGSAVASVAPAAVDPSLLEVLPATVDGRAIVETPEAEYGSVADAAVARAAARLAMGYVSSASGADWAIVSIVALRRGVWSDAFFRSWRDTYDAALCEPQGGVGGHAVATIGGRAVAIASCGPLRTYHVHLPAADLVVSVAAVGEARFGEQVMAGLRP